MTLHLAAWIAALGGTILTLWLLWSLYCEAKGQQTPRYQSHTWLVDEQRESLKAAAMPRFYKGYPRDDRL